MIKIDFKRFIRQHYWVGLFYWNNCKYHKHYSSNCEKCDEGKWRYIASKGDIRKAIENHNVRFRFNWISEFKYSTIFCNHIFRMPMNNVVWLKDDDI